MKDLERRIAQLQADLDARTTAFQELLAQHQAALAQQQPPLANIEDAPLSMEDLAVNRVAAKLPPFWPDSPSVWFAQIEAQFATARITGDQTRYDHVVRQLDSKHAAAIRDILTNPPATNKYETLKTALIKRMSPSEDLRVRQLLETAQLGDKRPSEFLIHMRYLAESTHIHEPLLRTLWLRQLPAHIQAILQTQSRTTLEDLAALADRIMDVAQPAAPLIQPAYAHQVHAIQASPLDATQRRLDELFREVVALKKRVNSKTEHQRAPSRGRSRTRTDASARSNSKPARASTPAGESTCWYHRRFGADAKNCVQPCSHENEASSS